MDLENGEVRINIQASQKVYYDQIITLARDEWEELKKNHPKVICETLQDYLDLTDISETDEFEEDFIMIAVDEKGKAVKPRDEYE